MSAYSTEGWSDLFVASAGASAALAGLLFVGVSINLTRILSLPGVATRAGQTLIVLGNALTVSLLMLAPGQDHVALGLEVLLTGAFVAGWTLRSQLGARKVPGARVRADLVFLTLAATMPFAIGGISLLAEAGGGLFWVLAGLAASLIVGLGNAWVLLVEIMR